MISFLLTLSLSGGSGQGATEPVTKTMTYADLVNRLVDLHAVALLPQPGEKTAQVSSYDRRSKYDAQTDRYLDWGANGDGQPTPTHGQEEQETVLADIQGPGCIWRIWTATAGKGKVKIYLDGSSEPTVDLPFSGYFDGKNAPFDRPALVYKAAAGFDNYVPISFQKSCRIVAERDWGKYYHFTYSQFPEGTKVPTFSRDLSEADRSALDRVNGVLSAKREASQAGGAADAKTETLTVEVGPGEKKQVVAYSGSGAITSLRAKVSGLIHRADEIAAMRELTLSMRWDGAAVPAVWSPLGDFFGTAMGLNRYDSIASGVNENGECYSNWFMPFENGAVIEVANDGVTKRQVTLQVTKGTLSRPASEYGRFHAKWHRDVFEPTRADRWPDWTVVTTQGRGRFCGMMLHVWNPRAGHCPQFGREGHWWWGEGDEKFFVDGEKFPSTFGTGTEDYFGYAWCTPDWFAQAFHGQTLTQNNKGHQVLHRWQLADSIPFQTSFEGYLEKYFPNEWPTQYAVTAYWYLDPKGTDPHGPAGLGERTGYYDLTPAGEGENLKVMSVSGGTAEPQTLLKDRGIGDSVFSGGSQLWWTKGRVGDVLKVAVPVVADGRYRVRLGMTRASDFGIGQIRFAEGAPLGPIDFFSSNLEPVEIDLGEVSLQRGEVPLTVEIAGKHAKSTGTMLGIDYVKLLPVK